MIHQPAKGGHPLLHRPTLRLHPAPWMQPHGIIGSLVAIAAFALIISSLAIAVGVVLPAVYATYGYHPGRNAASWAALPLVYAGSEACRDCHATEYAAWSLSRHYTVSCETCHGPLEQHASAGALAAAVPAKVPTSALCSNCHEATLGRPGDFPQAVLSLHYADAACLTCHDAHSTEGVNPPAVAHPLADMPACTTCHGGPDSIQPVPVGHTAAADTVCLACHQPASPGP